MSGLLYLIPDAPRDRVAERIAAAGMRHAYQRAYHVVECRAKELQASGCIIADAQACTADQVGYYPERQRWMQIPACGIYVGLTIGSPPKPAELARERMLAGHDVTLADGQVWQIPSALVMREFEVGIRPALALPRRWRLATDGSCEYGDVIAVYRDLYEVSLKLLESIGGAHDDGNGKADGFALSLRDHATYALAAIGANYRIGSLEEVFLLDLLDDEAVRGIIEAIIDLPTLMEYQRQKKTVTAESGIGSAAGSTA